MIDGHTKLIAHLGYPTHSFKAPMIYNPYFIKHKINAVVVPMGCKSGDYSAFLQLVFRLSNIHGALITMPYKVKSVAMIDEVSTTVKVAGALNAIRLDSNGRLIGDMFDGEGFTRGVARKGFKLAGSKVLVAGCGGVGCAIAASLAASGVAEMGVFDAFPASAEALAGRLRAHYPALKVTTGSNDPAGYDLVVNCTPLGMKPDDPLPMDVTRIAPTTFVGEVVMKAEITPFLAAARARGCRTQVGIDMLYEQIPAYLEFFGLPTTTAEELRAVAEVSY